MASFEEYLRDAIQRSLACNLPDNARFLAEQLVAAAPSEVRWTCSASAQAAPTAR
jgi:hypothetical protein